ncbi:hypothetical protein QGM61_02075 [Pseudohongiella sp. SYSU M77423]|uniref:hypothetical protein n=1 Tax=Pseudohongiella sp. SYSU M77423 TaxID=3042312 RepID=UPI0024818BD2|nr:hypothetical protein [Pseudohongiella sp. SYSU M77423]MDH7942596.1 hypothetical protein [Pseudohongiella sp. SYSU M77423]
MPRTMQYLLAAIGFVLLALLINFGVLDGSWRWDDSQILLHAHQFNWLQDFTNPEVWQQFSPANLTPLLILSFEVDLILFGLTPSMFYLHQLLALAAAAWMMFLCLKFWCRGGFAVLGGVLFLIGTPTLLVAQQLMTRHYAEGLVLALVALYGFVRFVRGGAVLWLVLALVSYALACMAKEVYVPLPLILLCIPDGTFAKRLRAAAPFFLLTLLYAIWRSWMLESVTGGYASTASFFSGAFIQQVVITFAGFPRLLGGGWWPVLTLAAVLVLVTYLYIKRHVPWRMLIVAAMVLLPLAPLVQSPGIVLADRYLLVVWAATSFAIAYMLSQVWQATTESMGWAGTGTVALTGLLALAAAVQGFSVRSALAAVGKEFDVQGQFLWQQDDSVAMIPSGNVVPAFWFVTGLRDFKQGLGLGSSPVTVVDDIYLQQSGVDQLYGWQQDCQCMVDISEQVPGRLAAYEDSLRPQAPLNLRYGYQGGYFTWQFGPYSDGQYHLVSDVIGVIPAPAAGQLRATLTDGAPFYIRYTSPEGWMTYSAQQRVVRDGPETAWSRE